jgi:hypothetical protein
MNSYEVVKRAIEFQTPTRLPVVFARLGQTDVREVTWNQIGTGPRNQKESLDEWGCLWVRSEVDNMGQVKGHPLEQWSNLEHYHWPNPDDSRFYEGMEDKFAGSEGKYILTSIFMLLFERMHSLRGFRNTLEDLYMEQEKVEGLADLITDYDLEIIRNISSRFPGQIHGLWFTDDWGTQADLIVSPKLWKEFFRPRYQRIVDLCHSVGWHLWMHSCGRINKLIPDLIEVGIDVINPQQPRVLGIEEIGRNFAGKICFSSSCDIQRTLPFEDEAGIRAEAELLLRSWGTPQGGFILSADEENDRDLGCPVEKQMMELKAFLEFDYWKGNPTIA